MGGHGGIADPLATLRARGYEVCRVGADQISVRPRHWLDDAMRRWVRAQKAQILAGLTAEARSRDGDPIVTGVTLRPTDMLAECGRAAEGIAGITAEEIYDALDASDRDDWRRGKIPARTLRAFAEARAERSQIERGKVPTGWDQQAQCNRCGPV